MNFMQLKMFHSMKRCVSKEKELTMNKKQIYHQGTRKKVVHITTVHHPYDPRIYYKQCMSLAENGYEVTLIAQDTRDKTEVNNINHIRLKKYKSRWKRM